MSEKHLAHQLHTELNPKLWDGNQLRREVAVALLKIAKEFYKFLEFPAPLKDIIVTGSQANYTYSDLSDLDLHLIVPFEDVQCDEPVDDLFDTKRKLWKLRHDITIHGVPVECYVEDLNKPVTGSSYSLIQDRWIQRPKKITGTIDNAEVNALTKQWLEELVAAMQSKDLSQLEAFKDELRARRQLALKQDGELSAGNLAFKNLRNMGAIDMLMRGLIKLKDRQLSI